MELRETSERIFALARFPELRAKTEIARYIFYKLSTLYVISSAPRNLAKRKNNNASTTGSLTSLRMT